MAITVNDAIQNNSPKSLDNKYLNFGRFLYTGTSEVNTTIHSAYRHLGLTVLVDVGGVPTEFWYKEGTTDSDLIPKVYDITTAANLGTISDGEEIYSTKVGNELKFKRIKAGANIVLTSFSDYIQIDGASPASGESNTGSNLGSGAAVFSSKVGVDLRFRTLVSGSGILITENSDTVSIAATTSGEINTVSNLGTGTGLYSTKVGVDLRFKSLVAGTGISLSSDSNEVTITALAPTGVITEGASVGTGNAVYKQKVSSTLQFKSLVAGTGIVINPSSDSLEIVSSVIPGEINTASNLGAGAGIYSTKVGVDLRFKSLIAGTNVTITPTANDIIISSTAPTGEANTASNLGTTGARVYSSKSGVDLRFRRIIAGNNVIVTENLNDISIDSTATSIAKDEFTLTTNGTRNANGEILAIRVRSASSLSDFRVGTTALGSNIISSSIVSATTWKTFLIYSYYETTTTFYFSGITSSTEVVIVTLNNVAVPPSGLNLTDLLDVDILTPTNGQVLTYDAGVWKNQTVAVTTKASDSVWLNGDGLSNAISSATLVNKVCLGVWRSGVSYKVITTGSPTTNQVLYLSGPGELQFSDAPNDQEDIHVLYRPI